MNIIDKTEIIESVASTGEPKYWRMYVGEDNGDIVTYTESWRLSKGVETKRVFSIPSVVKGKNLLRANATDDIAQAKFEMKSAYDKRNHRVTTELIRPVLAHKYQERGKSIIFPAVVQPKFDGVRRLYNTELGGWSRECKRFADHVDDHLLFETGDYIVDGEFMLPRKDYSLQETGSATRRYQESSKLLQYHIYNLIIPDDLKASFKTRRMILKDMFRKQNMPTQVFRVANHYVNDEAEMLAKHLEFVNDDWEGTMIYNIDAPYDVNKRSVNLQKYKNFDEDEFECIDIVEGNGSSSGCATFVLLAHNGKKFNCDPKGKKSLRQQYFQEKEEIIGEKVTVRYPSNQFTADGIPKFGKVAAVRNYE